MNSLFPEITAGGSPRRRLSPKRPVIATVAGSWTMEATARIRRAGAKVHCLPTSETDVDSLAFDGLLLLGGRDIGTKLYGEENRFAQAPDKTRDRLEWMLAARALQENIPILAICRGHQMLAVVAGSSLYQDIDEDLGIDHGATSHAVNLVAPELVSHFGGRRMRVNSYHHQAVANVPDGMRLGALSDEGIIEALYAPTVRSVQWHPELLGGGHAALFSWLVTAAALKM